MTDHIHQRILDAVQATLTAALTSAGDKVFLDRVDEVAQGDLPVIDILGPDESGADTITQASVHFPTLQQHAYSFTVHSVVALAEGSARAARNLAGEVEAALLAAADTIALDGVAIDLLLGNAVEQKDGSGSIPVFAVRQSWKAQFSTLSGAPTTPI